MSTEKLFFISRLVILITLMLGIRSYKHTTIFYKLILLHVVLAFITETIGSEYQERGAHNTFIYNTFLLVDIPIIIIAASKILKAKSNRIYAIISINLYCSLWFFNVYKHSIHSPVLMPFSLGCIILCILFLIISIQQYAYQQDISLRSPIVWICAAILIYYASNIPIFSFLEDLMLEPPKIARDMYRINILLSITHYICIGIAFILSIPKATLNKQLS